MSVYAAGNHKMEFISELTSLCKELNLENLNNYYVLAGDVNAKHTWCNASNNPRSVALHKWTLESGFELRPRVYCSMLPSYPRENSFLDICILDRRLILDNIIDDLETKSVPYDRDHNAIKFIVSTPANVPLNIKENKKSIKYNFAKTNWTAFKSALKNSTNLTIPDNRNLSNAEIDDMLAKVEASITETIAKKSTSN